MKATGKFAVLALLLAAAVAPDKIDGWATERLTNLDRNLDALERQAQTHQPGTRREIIEGVNMLRIRVDKTWDALGRLRVSDSSAPTPEDLQKEIHELNLETRELRNRRVKDPLQLPE